LRAVGKNDYYAVREQLDKGADIDRAVTFGMNCRLPLDCALFNGYRSIARLLIERGASLRPVRKRARPTWSPSTGTRSI
jgi:ankyrin repeat protein